MVCEREKLMGFYYFSSRSSLSSEPHTCLLSSCFRVERRDLTIQSMYGHLLGDGGVSLEIGSVILL